MQIGILALQGAYQAHAICLKKLNVFASYIRTPNELKATDGLIIPGGESSVLVKLLQQSGLWNELQHYSKPIFGVCAGAILLSQSVHNFNQPTLKKINIIVKRNAYGRQIASQIKNGYHIPSQTKLEMVFIRAPKIIYWDEKAVQVLARCEKEITAVQQGRNIAATFHPELSSNHHMELHQYFIEQVNHPPF